MKGFVDIMTEISEMFAEAYMETFELYFLIVEVNFDFCESLSNRSFLSRKGYHLQNYGESNSNMLPQNAHLSFPYFQTVASLKMKTCYFLNI